MVWGTTGGGEIEALRVRVRVREVGAFRTCCLYCIAWMDWVVGDVLCASSALVLYE